MKYPLAVALLLLAPPAHAQWLVNDPQLNTTAIATFGKTALAEAHAAQQMISEAQTVVNTVGILNAAAHGNVMGLTQLAPQLGLESNPLGKSADAQGAAMLISGAGEFAGMSGQLANLFQQAQANTITYRPVGNDWSARAMMTQAQAAAGQMAISQRYMDSGQIRLNAMPTFLRQAEMSGDIKSSVDAGNTIAGQQLTQMQQQNQLIAMQIYQKAQEDSQRSLAEQEHRRAADSFVASAQRAADNVRGGHSSFITQ
jgi:hypothetical protein